MPRYLYSFISHAHADNALCDPYAAALARLGVPHYYDRETPQVGHSLSLALQREIESAGVLIVLASPSSLASFWVNEEIDMFFALMAEDRSRKLIPIKVAPCDLPPRLKSRWWLDATTLSRDEVIAQLTHALDEASVDHPIATAATAAPAATARPSGYTRVVDWLHGGDHTTIPEAIAAARPGERILVRQGVYEGGLVIDKPLELVGDGQLGDVEIRASGTNVLKFTATQGRVANLTLRQTGDGDCYAVDITTGRLDLEDCDISSQSLACVGIYHGANPRVRRCRIHDGKTGGVYIYDQGQGLIEDCDIYAHTLAGVEINTGASPVLRKCRIHDNQKGVSAHNSSQGLIEDCDITTNAYFGVVAMTGATLTVRKCRINRNQSYAIWVTEKGGGVYEQNDLRDNGNGPWHMTDDSKPQVTRRGNTE